MATDATFRLAGTKMTRNRRVRNRERERKRKRGQEKDSNQKEKLMKIMLMTMPPTSSTMNNKPDDTTRVTYSDHKFMLVGCPAETILRFEKSLLPFFPCCWISPSECSQTPRQGSLPRGFMLGAIFPGSSSQACRKIAFPTSEFSKIQFLLKFKSLRTIYI